jgi:hypothetical protein
MSIKIKDVANKLNLSIEAILVIAKSLGIRWAHNEDSPIHPQTALRIVEFVKTGKDQQPVFLEAPPKKVTKTNQINNKQSNKPDASARKIVVWNDAIAQQARATIMSGRSVSNAIAKAAPKGLLGEYRKERAARRTRHENVDRHHTWLGKRVLIIEKRKFSSLNKPTETKKKKPSKISRREQLAEELGIKPTDAMLRKYPGSYGSSRR